MLIDNKAADLRLNSGSNLFNRLRASNNGNGKSKAMELFGVSSRQNRTSFIPAFESKSETVAAPVVEQANTITASEIKTGEVLEPEAPSIDDLLESPEKRIKLQQIHDNSLDVLDDTLKRIKIELPNITKPEKLADIAAKVSRIATDIRNDKSKQTDDKSVHFHFYTPERKSLTDFKEVTV